MDRQQLEKLFDEHFWKNAPRWKTIPAFDEKNVKQFIFGTVIPEVMEDIQKEFWDFNDWCWCCAWVKLDGDLKKRAKDLYWITL